MKTVLSIIIAAFSVSAMAEDKNVSCSTVINGVQSPLVSALLTKDNPRLDLAMTAEGISLSATNDSSSSLITLNITDTKTMEVYDAHGSLGDNGEGVVLTVPHKGKRYVVVCVKLRK